MRIVFVHSSDELYGADRILLHLLDFVAARRPDATVEVWLPDDLPHSAHPLCVELTARGVAWRHAPLPVLRRAYLRPGGVPGLSRRAARTFRLLRAHRPDLVYCTTSATFAVAPLARLGRAGAVVGHVQEIWSGTDRALLRGLAACCHQLIAISSAVAAGTGRLAGRVTVVPNGTADPGSAATRDATGDETGDAARTGLTFAVASRWNAWKGHGTLLAAWDRTNRGRLVVLGGPPASGARTDVPELVRALRRPVSVEVIGEVPDAAAHLAAADVVVVPSDRPEPFGLVAIEAFARGRPVIASAAGGLRDIVTDGEDGWTFPPGDVAALAALLDRLTADEVAAAGRAARRTYERRFTLDRFAADWLAAVGL